MTPQDFKALLDVLTEINANLAKIARLESLVVALDGLIFDLRALASSELEKRSTISVETKETIEYPKPDKNNTAGGFK